jgi:glutamine amidotransferase/cyclase
MSASKPVVTVLDYGAGNVRSLVNAVKFVGWGVKFVESSDDIDSADILIFPGVGAFGSAMAYLHKMKYLEPLRRYVCNFTCFPAVE